MTDTLRTALYVRVSTDSQAEKGFSIEAQLDKLHAYCDSNKIKNYEEYVDKGYSAGSIDRPSLKNLIADIKMGYISTVIVYKLDRLSRKTKDTLYLIEDIFNKNNVKFVSLTENIDTSTSSGKFFISILSSVAQLERENIRERGMLGMEKKAALGYKSRTPKILIGYDYDKENKKYIVNDYEAMQVREIFDKYLNSEGIGNIYRYLHKNYTTKYGQWKTAKQVSLILDNEAYIGRLKHRHTYKDSVNIPPIIDAVTFEKVREIRNYNKEHYYRHNSSYLLTGLIYCGECGARLRGLPKYDRTTFYYVCYSRTRISYPHMAKSGNCGLGFFRCDKTDEEVLKTVKSVVRSKTFFEKAKSTHSDNNYEQVDILKKEIKKLDERASRIMDLFIETGLDKQNVIEKITENNKQKENLETQLKSLIAKLKPKTPVTYEIAKELAFSLDGASLEEKRIILSKLINKILFYKNKEIKIEFNF